VVIREIIFFRDVTPCSLIDLHLGWPKKFEDRIVALYPPTLYNGGFNVYKNHELHFKLFLVHGSDLAIISYVSASEPQPTRETAIGNGAFVHYVKKR
jgi:hypothetical protein